MFFPYHSLFQGTFSLQTLPIPHSLRASRLHLHSRLVLLFYGQILDKDKETSTLFAKGTPEGPVKEKEERSEVTEKRQRQAGS